MRHSRSANMYMATIIFPLVPGGYGIRKFKLLVASDTYFEIVGAGVAAITGI